MFWEVVLKIWIGGMPFAFIILLMIEKEKYNPFDERPPWLWFLVMTIGWPVHYGFAIFHKRRG